MFNNLSAIIRSRTLERRRDAVLSLIQNNIQSRLQTLEIYQRPLGVIESTQSCGRESSLLRRDTDPCNRNDQLLSVRAALLVASSMHVSANSRLNLIYGPYGYLTRKMVLEKIIYIVNAKIHFSNLGSLLRTIRMHSICAPNFKSVRCLSRTHLAGRSKNRLFQ